MKVLVKMILVYIHVVMVFTVFMYRLQVRHSDNQTHVHFYIVTYHTVKMYKLKDRHSPIKLMYIFAK